MARTKSEIKAVQDRLLSIADALVRLPIGRTKFNEILIRGEIRSCKIGARRLVDGDSLEAFISEAFSKSASAPND
jgi:hypothetical protein